MKFSPDFSTLAGFSRSVALLHYDSPAARFAADFVAPSYVSYVQWLIQDAHHKNIKKLYFLSRDSYILYQIAKKIASEGISYHYLFLSRRALLLPYLAVAGFNEKSFLRVMDKHSLHARSLSIILDMFGLSIDKRKFDFQIIRTHQQEQQVLEYLFHGPGTADLQHKSQEQLKLFSAYLLQEKVTEGETAMVDIGWLGTGRVMLNTILDYLKRPRTFFYYFGTRKPCISSEYGEWETYLKPDELSTRLTFMIEDYFSASPYTTTTGYAQNGNRIVPLLKDGMPDKQLVAIHLSVAETFVEQLQSIPFTNDILKRWCQTLLKALDTHPIEIDLNPLKGICVHVLSVKELFKYSILGCAYERSSVLLTCGFHTGKVLIFMNNVTSSIKRYLYRQLHHNEHFF